MKKVLTILLAAILLFASMSNAVVFLCFKINQSEIARTLCINRTKPNLHCKGKCILNERLAENNGKDSSPAPFSKLEETLRLTLYFHLPVEYLPKSMEAFYPHTFNYRGLQTQSSEVPFLHPPEICLAVS